MTKVMKYMVCVKIGYHQNAMITVIIIFPRN